MKTYRADLHIHTLLSPCADLDMSPANIIAAAARKKLDIIGITDHNSTRQSGLVKKLGKEKEVFVLQGAEITTKEEIHCIVFFENPDALEAFQEYIDASLPEMDNDPLLFGDQVVVDEEENIIYMEERLLINATSLTMEELGSYAEINDGLFIPAHIDRHRNSIYSQLGFLPDGLKADALEVSRRTSPGKFAKEKPEIKNFTLVTNSDAHYPDQIGTVWNNLRMEKITFEEIKMAFAGINGRTISTK